jgi:hypothetical protein
MLKYHHSVWNAWEASSAGSTSGGNPNGGVAVAVGAGVGVGVLAVPHAESTKPTIVIVKIMKVKKGDRRMGADSRNCRILRNGLPHRELHG